MFVKAIGYVVRDAEAVRPIAAHVEVEADVMDCFQVVRLLSGLIGQLGNVMNDPVCGCGAKAGEPHCWYC